MSPVKEKEPAVSAEMQKRIELGTPGAPHKLLARMAGKWKTSTRAWTEPGKPPVESSGTSEQVTIFGGRYLQEIDAGEMAGIPFTGMAISGYDNNSGKYFTTWMDSMSTNLTVFEGSASTDGKTITQESSVNDPVRGPMKLRVVNRVQDDDHYTFEMYATDKSGKEMKMMEMNYTREG